MSLPILKVVNSPTPETLVRYFHQTEANWTAHLSESEELGCGTAWMNAQLAEVHPSNRILDAALSDEMDAPQAVELASAHYVAKGLRCLEWVMNPSAPPAQTEPLVKHLLSNGYAARHELILYMSRITGGSVTTSSLPLKIIPARASFKHARSLLEECAGEDREPKLADAGMLHLDDPHYDALLALLDGRAIAMAGVLSLGEIARIAQVFVSAAYRRRGVGSTMMTRALEICARSLHKHIFVSVAPEAAAAAAMYASFGFQQLGMSTTYQATSTSTSG